MQKKSKLMFIVAILCFAMATFALTDQAPPAVQAQTLEALQSQRAQIQADLAQAQADVNNLSQQSSSLQAQLDSLNAESMVQQEEYNRLSQELQVATANMEAAIKAHEQAILDLNQKEAEYESRINSMFKIRNKSTLEVMLESDSVSGFFTNLRLMEYVSQVDSSMVQQLDDARVVAQAKKEIAEQTKREYDAFVAEKQLQLDQLASGIAATQTNLESLSGQLLARSGDVNNLQSQEFSTTAALDALIAEMNAQATQDAENARIAEQQRQEAAAAAAQSGGNQSAAPPASSSDINNFWSTGSSTGAVAGDTALIYPLANSTTISSGFGYRDGPYGGMHWGVDFPAPAGTPIRACQSGVVKIVEVPLPGSIYGGWSAGNYCVIMADNGMLLMYAHQKDVAVYQGQRVQQGEVIGYVGSTGWSTGPHLHLQLKVPWDGSLAVDPMAYMR